MTTLSPSDGETRSNIYELKKDGGGALHQTVSPIPNVKEYSKEIPKEWVTQAETVIIQRGEIKNSKPHKSLVANRILGAVKESKAYRYPWEAFADVGFRSALSVNEVK